MGAKTIPNGDASRLLIPWLFGCKPKKGEWIIEAGTAGWNDRNSMFITQENPLYLHFVYVH